MLLAEEDGRLVGTLSLKNHKGLLDLGMMVSAADRGRGVGRALMDSAFEQARELKAHKITLQVWPHNVAAIALYERFGFEREGYLRRQWKRKNGEIWDAVVMGILLDDGEAARD
jgi:RimJ/RimL family protein N-acetyltransferase